MTPDQLEAHLRLLAALRERTRTHEQRAFLKEQGSKRTVAEQRTIIDTLRRMEKEGYSRKAMREECKCSNHTVIHILGNCKRNKRNAKGLNQHRRQG